MTTRTTGLTLTGRTTAMATLKAKIEGGEIFIMNMCAAGMVVMTIGIFFVDKSWWGTVVNGCMFLAAIGFLAVIFLELHEIRRMLRSFMEKNKSVKKI
jgi:hypothetical protein